LARFPKAQISDVNFTPIYGGAVGELRLPARVQRSTRCRFSRDPKIGLGTEIGHVDHERVTTKWRRESPSH
jgi:hypothetical protein